MRKILIVFAITLLLSRVDATCANSAAQGAAEAGKCCYSWDGTAGAIALLKATGVDTCAANGTPATTNFGSQVTRDATACIAGYALNTGVCTICPVGTYSAAGATTCTACPAGTYVGTTGSDASSDCTPCPAGTYLTTTGNDNIADCIACDATKGSPAGSIVATACVACTGLTTGGKNCDSTSSATQAVPTSCLDGYVLNGSANPKACVQCTVTNCNVCTVAGATDDCTTCKSGFRAVAKAAPTNGSCVACAVAGCDTCTAGTPEVCNKCKEGFFKTVANNVITACTQCTTIEGCTSCTGDATACMVAKPGWYLKDGSPKVLTKCPAGQTNLAGATGADDATGCTIACDAGTNCQDCRADQTQCVDCGSNFYLDTTTCQAHDAASLHPSCKTAWGIDSQGNANSCLTCNDVNKVLVPAVAASADGKTAASLYGMCKCQEAFKTTAAANATSDSTCTPCGDGVKNCDDANKLVCKDATFIQAGVNCVAKPTDNTAVAGFFFNSTSNKFQACDKSCATCTAAGSASACKTCPATTGTTAPASTDAAFEKWLQKPWFNATTCFATCPDAYVANEAQESCEESSSSSFLSVIALILIALLF